MIEKLDVIKDTRNVIDKNGMVHTVANFTAVDKINELVDAVNEMQAQVAILQEHAHPTAKTEPAENANISKMENVAENGKSSKMEQDPFAEQRKWVGKLCKFWLVDAEHPTFGILDFVDAGPHPEPFHTDCGESEQGWYPHCEPVKPDDDIIYKGE